MQTVIKGCFVVLLLLVGEAIHAAVLATPLLTRSTHQQQQQ
jgi:hypothetical protein